VVGKGIGPRWAGGEITIPCLIENPCKNPQSGRQGFMKARILVYCILLGLLLADLLTPSETPGTAGFAVALDDFVAHFVSGSF
jgi:hypothetical protein